MKSEAITELKKLGISKERNTDRWAKLGLEVSELQINFYKLLRDLVTRFLLRNHFLFRPLQKKKIGKIYVAKKG